MRHIHAIEQAAAGATRATGRMSDTELESLALTAAALPRV